MNPFLKCCFFSFAYEKLSLSFYILTISIFSTGLSRNIPGSQHGDPDAESGPGSHPSSANYRTQHPGLKAQLLGQVPDLPQSDSGH